MKKITLPKFSELAAREKLLAVGGIAVVFILVCDKMVITPWWHHVRRMREEIHRFEREVLAHRKLLSHQSDVASAMGVYHDYVRTARSVDVEMGDLVREIEQLGAQSGVTLGNVTPLPAQQQPPYQQYSVDVQYYGTLEESVRFLYAVQSSKWLFQVQKATLGLEKKGEERLLGTLRLSSVALQERPLSAAKP